MRSAIRALVAGMTVAVVMPGLTDGPSAPRAQAQRPPAPQGVWRVWVTGTRTYYVTDWDKAQKKWVRVKKTERHVPIDAKYSNYTSALNATRQAETAWGPRGYRVYITKIK